MKLSNAQEDTSGPRKLYLGIENFQATAVNPTLAELQAMGIPATSEPEYVTTVERDFDGTGDKTYDAINIRVYLTNDNPAMPIKTQVNYQIIRHSHTSSTNKLKVVNKYGSSTWLEQKYIDSNTLPSNMSWFVGDDIKICLRGEDTFLSFLKAYRNLPNIQNTSDTDTRKKGISVIEKADWDKMFKGDFKDIRDAILGIGDKGKVGFLLGVRHLEDKDVQTLYKNSPLKRYIKKVGGNEYLTKEVIASQEAGSFADTTFDTSNYKIREYNKEGDKVTPDNPEDYVFQDDHDDLPF